jgi:hypothetical protein
MKKLLLMLVPLAVFASTLPAATDAVLDAVRSADDARVAATIAASPDRMDAIFSKDLVYTHGTGVVNDRASYIASIVTGKTKYLSFAYESRNFVPVAPGIVLMRGRCLIHSENSGQPVENYLAYLAVWRLENGAWRFLAWQSCHMPPAKA